MRKLTYRGYVISKDDPKLNIEKIRRELTITEKLPYGSPIYLKPKKLSIYMENKNKLYMPRHYGIKKFGEPLENKLSNPYNIEIASDIILRDYQKDAYNKIKNHLLENGTGLVSLYTGYGKTILILKLIRDLGIKSLFIVPSVRLLKQTIQKIEEFLPDATIGVIQQNRMDTVGKDIVVGMLHSIARRDYSSSIFDGIGLCIYDEVHLAASEDLSRCLFKINTKYILGLSATVERDDGLTNILKFHIGDIFYEKSAIRTGLQSIVKIYKYKNSEFCVKLNKQGKSNRAEMLNDLVNNDKRNDFIIDLIKNILLEDENRQILVLGERRVGLEFLKLKLPDNITSGLILGQKTVLVPTNTGEIVEKLVKMKDNEIEESKKCQVILGTYQACGIGIDIPTLNTLIFMTPMNKIKQAEGRIFRKTHTEIHPLVIDIVDQYGPFQRSEYFRKQFYKDLKYKIMTYKVVEKGEKRETTNIKT